MYHKLGREWKEVAVHSSIEVARMGERLVRLEIIIQLGPTVVAKMQTRLVTVPSGWAVEVREAPVTLAQ